MPRRGKSLLKQPRGSAKIPQAEFLVLLKTAAIKEIMQRHNKQAAMP